MTSNRSTPHLALEYEHATRSPSREHWHRMMTSPMRWRVVVYVGVGACAFVSMLILANLAWSMYAHPQQSSVPRTPEQFQEARRSFVAVTGSLVVCAMIAVACAVKIVREWFFVTCVMSPHTSASRDGTESWKT